MINISIKSNCLPGEQLRKETGQMKVIGINYSTNASGTRVTTLHIAEDFNPYYSNQDAGRCCEGKKVDAIYLGDYDCSAIKVGMDVDILYDKAIKTAKGTFQPIKRIEILK